MLYVFERISREGTEEILYCCHKCNLVCALDKHSASQEVVRDVSDVNSEKTTESRSPYFDTLNIWVMIFFHFTIIS
jgi:hypothetical protein